MKAQFIALIMSAAIPLGALAQQHIVEVGDFSELRIDSSIDVTYKCHADSAGCAVFDGPADAIAFDNNRRGRITVTTSGSYRQGSSVPTITIYSSDLTKAVNSGDLTVRLIDIPAGHDKINLVLMGDGSIVAYDIECKKLDADIKSGEGSMTVTGRCDNASLHVVGDGVIQADRLAATKVTATIVGAGTIGCDPLQQLSVQGVGSGMVWYRTVAESIKNRGVGITAEQM